MSVTDGQKPRGARAGVASVRARVAAVERALALGVAALILGSMLSWSLALNVVAPVLGPVWPDPGTGADLLSALVDQLGLIIVLPALAWGAGWILESRPLTLTLSAAIFVEVWLVAVAYLAEGGVGLTGRPVYRVARVVLVLAIGYLASLAYRHGRGQADARERSRRRIAPPRPIPAPTAPADGKDDAQQA